MLVLTLNAGSSSLKFSVIDAAKETLRLRGSVDWVRSPAKYTLADNDASTLRVDEFPWEGFGPALARVAEDTKLSGRPADRIDAVAHRVVHGGPDFTQPIQITPQVEESLRELIPLAPLHLPAALDLIRESQQQFSDVPHIAVFDTAFHATIPEHAAIYPIPYEWSECWRLRRFGFHGLSHAYCAERTMQLTGDQSTIRRLVIAHVGNGVSVTAVRDGQSVDTTMGFTPLEGAMMGTRCGSVDPGLLIHLQRNCGIDIEQLDRSLNTESGLLGVSGISGDIRRVSGEAKAGHQRSQLALDIYVYRLRQAIAAMTASLSGLDGLVFTGGVGTNWPDLRTSLCEGLGFLGIELDTHINLQCVADAVVSSGRSNIPVVVIHTREDVMLARQAFVALRDK